MKRVALGLSLAFPAAAAAAAEQPPSIPSWKQSHLEAGNQVVQSTYRAAACARVQRREAAEAVLATVPGSAEEEARLQVAVPAGWADCPIRYPWLKLTDRVLLRGALAEALYHGDRKKPRAESALPLDEGRRFAGSGSSLAVARWVARCAVRRNPRLAHEVVKWVPGSIGEGRALRSLNPVFLDCLPAGERLRISRINIRALIAEELYRASVTFKESFAHAK